MSGFYRPVDPWNLYPDIGAPPKATPENLLAVISYSSNVVTVSEYGYGPYRLPITGIRTHCKTEQKLIKLVTESLRGQVADGFCGFTIEAPATSDDETVVRVYKLPDHLRCHRLKVSSDLVMSAGWLQRFLGSLKPLHVYSDAAARGELGLTSSANEPVSDKLHLFADRNDHRERAEAKLSPSDWVKKNLPHWNLDPLAAVNTQPDESDVRDPSDHIPALRGLFALARGDYATVSAEDLTAAMDAAYVHPDVLAAVADEIASATEKASEDAWDQGYAAGCEAETSVEVRSKEELEAHIRKLRAEVVAAEYRLGALIVAE